MAIKLFSGRNHHPFCGFDLQISLRWAAMIAVFGNIYHIFSAVTSYHKDFTVWQGVDNPLKLCLLSSIWVVDGCRYIAAFISYYVLLRGVNKKSIPLLKFYMGCATTITLISIAVFLMYAIQFSIGVFNFRLARILSPGIYRFYIIYAVYRFIQEIKYDVEMTTAYRDLTELEMNEFKNGLVALKNESSNPDNNSFSGKFLYEKYDKKVFEISMTDLELDRETPLGSGAYGTVYRALLNMKTTGEKLPVAVKTTNPLFGDVEHFKALLSELKVMTFIGTHTNIVNLIGACTEDIRQRKLYIVVELCGFGNLQTFLRSQRGTFVDIIEGTTSSTQSQVSISLDNDAEEVTNTKDLLLWAKQVTGGMSFLGSLRIIHGDLASRNVLLTEHRVAKITNFGLSRKLYNCDVYIKTQKNPIPWKWLSVEAITDRCFASCSDVWSYGVTLWEIFQLGEVPWAGCTFGLDFVNDLKRGRRMGRPKYATQLIYDIMMSCWYKTPENCPIFQNLSDNLHATFLKLNEPEHLDRVKSFWDNLQHSNNFNITLVKSKHDVLHDVSHISTYETWYKLKLKNVTITF